MTAPAAARAFVDALLAFVFPGGVPAWVDRLVDREVVARRLEDFKLNPVLPVDDAARPARIALSDGDEAAGWEAAVVEGLGDPRVGAFLGLAPRGTRRMIDTDGACSELYLDDLQDVAHGLVSPTVDPLMCWTLSLPRGERAVFTRHVSPPWARVCDALAGRIDALMEQGATGIWGVRWRDGAPKSVLWVSEARWRGDHEAKTEVFEAALGRPARWRAMRELAARHGLVAYPDAVELGVRGEVDLTVGFLRG